MVLIKLSFLPSPWPTRIDRPDFLAAETFQSEALEMLDFELVGLGSTTDLTFEEVALSNSSFVMKCISES